MVLPRSGFIALVALLALAVPAVAACVNYPGEIFVPTLTNNIPPGSPSLLIGVVVQVPAGAHYTLTSVTPPTTVVGTPCTTFPDFNAAWYATSMPFDQQLANHDTCGNQGGTIPGPAHYGVVYMRYGPDASTGDEHVGASFQITICGN